jgi:hypothetical protein
MEVDVEYLAAPRNFDDRRRIGIEFVEKDAPYTWLEIRTAIRAPISVFPAQPTIVPARQSDRETFLEIHNCTERDFHIVTVRSLTPWLTIRRQLPITCRTDPHARQTWRIDVEARTEGLRAARHQAQVEIHTDCVISAPIIVPVELDLRKPARCVPKELAFGTLDESASAKRKVLIHYATQDLALGLPQVSLTHNMGKQLQLIYAALSASYGELSATLTPSEPNSGSDLTGVVVVTFAGVDLLPLEIPVSARVSRR